ncbi:MAG TPA: response regulator transcription factor [Candidatus Saccharimonadales bacterium]|nr:response regulator transcription factor [Candidatus Saccharimonadales bacterium]
MKILVVEDEQKIANAIKKGLEQESYAVDVVYNGDEGLSYALDPDYDLVVLDRMLPGQDGLSICRQLRAEKIHTPVLILTARGQTDDRVAGLDAGADDYLVKPFAFEELLARIRALLRRPQKTLQTLLAVDDLVIDVANKAVRRGDTDITLTSKQYSLLEYMVRHEGQLITKDALIAHVWNDEADILPNTVEVYIGYLRNKIDRAFKNRPPLIYTVRGFGYRLGEKRS